MPDEKPECSFCGRNQQNTRLLIEGSNVIICRECVVKGMEFLTSIKPKHRGVKKTYLASELGRKCSFCTRKLIDVRASTSINDGNKYICDECLMVCFDIILRNIFGERRPSKESLRSLVDGYYH